MRQVFKNRVFCIRFLWEILLLEFSDICLSHKSWKLLLTLLTWLPSTSKMSWLNTSSIANLAKNALKEAQKTIDKALDIRDPDTVGNKPIENGIHISVAYYDTWLCLITSSVAWIVIQEIFGHFFESFNLVKEENDPPDETRSNSEDVVVSEPDSKSERDQQKGSKHVCRKPFIVYNNVILFHSRSFSGSSFNCTSNNSWWFKHLYWNIHSCRKHWKKISQCGNKKNK